MDQICQSLSSVCQLAKTTGNATKKLTYPFGREDSFIVFSLFRDETDVGGATLVGKSVETRLKNSKLQTRQNTVKRTGGSVSQLQTHLSESAGSYVLDAGNACI